MTYRPSYLLYFLLFFICIAATNEDLEHKILRQDGYQIECYVIKKENKTKNDGKMYYWFKSGKVHHSQGDIGGDVLHSKFKKYFRSKQLAEQGYFKYGLKHGVWNYWFKNGNLKETINWNNGFKNGDYVLRDSLNNPILVGKYKNNKKHGVWIKILEQDTLRYKNGKEVLKLEAEESPKEKKQSFFSRIFKKKNTEKTKTKKRQKSKKKKDKK